MHEEFSHSTTDCKQIRYQERMNEGTNEQWDRLSRMNEKDNATRMNSREEEKKNACHWLTNYTGLQNLIFEKLLILLSNKLMRPAT